MIYIYIYLSAAVTTLIKNGFTVNIEESSGVGAKFLNDDYAAAGASVGSAAQSYNSDILLKGWCKISH